MPRDILQYIAENIKTNIREVEGSLNKLIALYKLNNNDVIDISLASEALRDIVSSQNNRKVTPELILDIVSDHFNIPVSENTLCITFIDFTAAVMDIIKSGHAFDNLTFHRSCSSLFIYLQIFQRIGFEYLVIRQILYLQFSG